MAALSMFSCCISLALIPNLSGGAENLHNYFLKVDVKCLQIAKGFLSAFLFTCGLLCRESQATGQSIPSVCSAWTHFPRGSDKLQLGFKNQLKDLAP